MNDYQHEQLDALRIARDGLVCITHSDLNDFKRSTDDYLRFRQAVDLFLKHHFSSICTQLCYQSQTSACCSKDGIITFFADTVINALHAAPGELDRMETALNRDNRGHRCIYLTADGCMWTIRPVVCAMFLCDRAMDTAFTADPTAKAVWEDLRRQEKTFKWPDRPVLFDHIEQVFMARGYRSSLMHLNLSPGLLRVKRLAGLTAASSFR
jgi:hypothetical protein